MRPWRLPCYLSAVLLLSALAAACGDDSGGDTSAPPTTAATTTTGTSTTATTAAPTTTAAPATTITLPADAHPVLGIGWSAVWPADGSQATYRAVDYDGAESEVAARLDYGVEWEGGVWDRLTVGEADFGGTGAAFYFDRSEPWVLRLWGVETFSADMPDGQVQREWFAEPLVLELGGEPTTAAPMEGTLNLAFYRDTPPDLEFGYEAEGVLVGMETLEIPAGTVEGALHVRFTLGGDFMGGAEATSDVWAHPEWFLLKWEETLAFRSIELASPWG